MKLLKPIAVAGCALFGSCAGIKMGAKVRTGDMAWLADCPMESRRTLKALGVRQVGEYGDPGTVQSPGFLRAGESVILHPFGVEIRDGPILVEAEIGWPVVQAGSFYGTAAGGVDGASLRFHTLVLEDGRRFPICGLGGQHGLWPGLDLASKDDPNRVPDSELHPGYVYVVTATIEIRLATESWPRGLSPKQ